MVQEIFSDLYRLEIPLPGNPLKSVNSYVIRSGDRNLIIDTALNMDSCHESFMKGLKRIDVRPDRSDLFITHMHPDHAGLVHRMVSNGTRVYFSEIESSTPRDRSFWLELINFARTSGISENDIEAMHGRNRGFRYETGWLHEILPVKEGLVLEIGGCSFKCLETPGHTMGHICLYDEKKRILISGDHILGDITPNITCWSDREDRLSHYLKSLRKVYDLDIELVLPGHRSPFYDHRKRIKELEEHHEKRSEEVLDILMKGPKSAAEVAKDMTWDIKCSSWKEFPAPQRWFATGEAKSHLRFLEEKGRIERKILCGLSTYYVSGT